MSTLEPNHPKVDLVFAVVGGTRPHTDVALERALEQLGRSRHWSLGPPEVVELADEGRVGGVLQVYSALPPWGDKLPKDLDTANFSEVSALVEALKSFSRDYEVDIEIVLGGVDVGVIRRGTPNSSLSDGLLGEWKRVLYMKP